MVISFDGGKFYLVVMGFGKLVCFDINVLVADFFMFSEDNQVMFFGGGFIGVVLDSVCNWVYVVMCFDNGIFVVSIVNLMIEMAYIWMFNFEFVVVKNGCRFMYDVNYMFSCGDLFCVGCYVFGDMDYFLWDLGNLDEEVVVNCNVYNINIFCIGCNDNFYLMKGLMMI